MPIIVAPDINNAASPNAFGPNSREVKGEASIVIPNANAAPPVRVKALSAKEPVPFLRPIVGVNVFPEDSVNVISSIGSIIAENINRLRRNRFVLDK